MQTTHAIVRPRPQVQVAAGLTGERPRHRAGSQPWRFLISGLGQQAWPGTASLDPFQDGGTQEPPGPRTRCGCPPGGRREQPGVRKRISAPRAPDHEPSFLPPPLPPSPSGAELCPQENYVLSSRPVPVNVTLSGERIFADDQIKRNKLIDMTGVLIKREVPGRCGSMD